jgi:hypothetical protein
MKRFMGLLVSAFIVLSLFACGGGDGGSSAAVDTSVAAGVWFGTATSTDTETVDIVGIVSTDGQLRLSVESGVCSESQYKGDVTSMNGGDGSGTFTGYATFGCVFSDGSTVTSGPMSFNVSGSTMTGSYSSPGDQGLLV